MSDKPGKPDKPKVAVSWNSSCGGCDEAIVDLDEKLLETAAQVEFVLWPCAMDFKYEEVEKMADNEITVALINGGIQNTHQEHIARLLRRKSRLVAAFGSCACMGGVPSLANLTAMKEVFKTSYLEGCPTVDNPEKTVPLAQSEIEGNTLTLPEIFESLKTVDQVISVDYYLPGCPPTAAMIGETLEAILTGNLPKKGTVIAPNISLCSSCSRNGTKPDIIEMKKIKRIHQVEADPQVCFLAQDILCMGPATRDGCDYPCVKGNMPCTGCMGPVENSDQGAQMISALGGIVGGETAQEADEIIGQIVDPAGTFYRYGVAGSLLGKGRKK